MLLTIIHYPKAPSNSQNYIIVILAAAPPCSKNTFNLARDDPLEMEATSSVTQLQVQVSYKKGIYISFVDTRDTVETQKVK